MKAIMGMAIGALAIVNSVNLAAITVPTLLVNAAKDRTRCRPTRSRPTTRSPPRPTRPA